MYSIFPVIQRGIAVEVTAGLGLPGTWYYSIPCYPTWCLVLCVARPRVRAPEYGNRYCSVVVMMMIMITTPKWG